MFSRLGGSPLTPTLSRKREREHDGSFSLSLSLSRVLVGEGWGEGGPGSQGRRLKLPADREQCCRVQADECRGFWSSGFDQTLDTREIALLWHWQPQPLSGA